MVNTAELIEKVAAHNAETTFSDKYKRPDNLEERRLEGLGIAIASWTSWAGDDIMVIFAAALEDANFHSEAGKVRDMLADLLAA
jgi:hypothetical protein